MPPFHIEPTRSPPNLLNFIELIHLAPFMGVLYILFINHSKYLLT